MGDMCSHAMVVANQVRTVECVERCVKLIQGVPTGEDGAPATLTICRPVAKLLAGMPDFGGNLSGNQRLATICPGNHCPRFAPASRKRVRTKSANLGCELAAAKHRRAGTVTAYQREESRSHRNFARL